MKCSNCHLEIEDKATNYCSDCLMSTIVKNSKEILILKAYIHNLEIDIKKIMRYLDKGLKK